MKIAIIGAGYVGLVSGACLADFGHRVTCIDKDADRIADLRAGKIPIYEPGLATIVAANLDAGNLQFATDLDAVRGSEVLVLSRGMQLMLRTCPETLALLRERGIPVHVEETRAAVALYNRLAEKIPVGGLFHSTC